jgi:hypothetical protein
MKIKLGDLVLAHRVLVQLADERVPIALAYRLATVLRQVEPDMLYYEQTRAAAVRTYGEVRAPTDDERALGTTEVLTVRPEHLETYRQQMNELAAVDVDLAVRPLTMIELEGLSLRARDVLTLGPLVWPEVEELVPCRP